MVIHADLHIHTVLSPCGDPEMSPVNIVRTAKEKGIGIIGITDHNSTRQASIIRNLGQQFGLYVLRGAEITTQEEAHCLAFFENNNELTDFQNYLDKYLPPIQNNPEKFGYQVVANIHDEIIYQEDKLLISAIDRNIKQIEQKVRELNGIFIPAHIDKQRFSILSQLGFIPNNLQYDALELSANTNLERFLTQHPELRNNPFIQSSDAHYPDDIGKVVTPLELDDITFESIRKSIREMIQ